MTEVARTTPLPEASTPKTVGFRRTKMIQVELGRPLPAISPRGDDGSSYQRALVVVRLHTSPIGLLYLDLPEHDLAPDAYRDRIWDAFGVPINEHLARDGRPPRGGLDRLGLPDDGSCHVMQAREAFLRDPPFVSVVVCTRDRTDQLVASLAALRALTYPNFEIVVVDNAPTTTATHDLVARLIDESCGPRIRYVREDRPGLAVARNCGLHHARGDLIAYTDDDVIPDAHWLTEVARGFGRSADVACVTGLTLPAELEAPAQAWFEQFGGFGLGFVARTYRAGDSAGTRSPGVHLLPYAAGQYGSGNNMAFTASFLHSVGGFDPALGPGTLAQGGEDLAALFQVIDGGHALVYEPGALIFHYHRRTYEELARQVRAYGVGFAAYLTKVIVDRPRRVLGLIAKLPRGVGYLLSPASAKNRNKVADFPPELTRSEVTGMLYGPLAYARSVVRLRRAARR